MLERVGVCQLPVWVLENRASPEEDRAIALRIITQSTVQSYSAYSLPASDYKVTYGTVGQRLSCELCREFPRIAEIDGGKLQRSFSLTEFDYFQRSSHVQP